ncbi:tetratricopeptide repeat protein [Okeania sp. SIO2B3]|uniref:tetratricopeptide repeat protein n=1 Tax=Okeania sp. SIO2B3 TaxID=2607784 RepID=UPI0013BEBBB6|nr:tetratricopeptide repeat protein [Okeania sp. SIO2B3]NET41832.1 tetratricopeptide repeat protein [Okeania sp. SIO2B3]
MTINRGQKHEKDYYEKMSRDLIKQGEIESALTASYMTIGLDFYNSWCYWHTLGNLFREKSKYDQAIAAYQSAIKLNSSFSWCWYNLGDCLEKKGNLEDAVAAFLTATKLYPNFKVFNDRLIKAKNKVSFLGVI